MVRLVTEKLRPSRGFAHILHLILVAILPVMVFIFVRMELYSVALAIILLSKWRMFAVKPRHWAAHIRTNAVDIIVSLSILAFMISAESMAVQILWLIVFEFWVLYLKPGSSLPLVTLQALLAQLGGLIAVFLVFEEVSLAIYIIMVSAIAYFSARHFFASFSEQNFNVYSWTWAFFAGCLTWVLGHWLLFYGPIAQAAMLISVIGYGLATIYYLHETDRLSTAIQRQVIFVVFAVVFVLIAFSQWSDKAI